MSLWGRCIAFFLAFVASTACPAMGVVPVVAAAGHTMGPAHFMADEAVSSPVPECCLGPAHDTHEAGPVSVVTPRVDGMGVAVASLVLCAWTAEEEQVFVPPEESPPPLDFACRSMMKRE